MRNSSVEMSHYGPLLAFTLTIEHVTFLNVPAIKILKKQRTQTMRCETSASYKVSQRPPPDRR
jgi:hypothetical protein